MNTISKEQFYELVGSSIVNKRKELGFTQTDLANKTGMSRTSIVNIEKGRQYPPVHLLWELSNVLNCTPAEILPEFSNTLFTKEEKPSLKRVILKETKGKITEESVSKIKSFISKI